MVVLPCRRISAMHLRQRGLSEVVSSQCWDAHLPDKNAGISQPLRLVLIARYLGWAVQAWLLGVVARRSRRLRTTRTSDR